MNFTIAKILQVEREDLPTATLTFLDEHPELVYANSLPGDQNLICTDSLLSDLDDGSLEEPNSKIVADLVALHELCKANDCQYLRLLNDEQEPWDPTALPGYWGVDENGRDLTR